ncbi:MAG: type II toxin-antitoxin system prevent-host-death family antitoxin [Saprospiraceae bacterium]|nr:type II toxin-antitoxin system prevent-host-death family antitoxin [Pyrinomonadaceae bacterium]
MTKVNMHEAKSRLSKLVEMAKNGEDVIIAKNGVPEARIVPYVEEEVDWFGMDAGKGWIADDFDELPPDILAAFYGEDEETDSN